MPSARVPSGGVYHVEHGARTHSHLSQGSVTGSAAMASVFNGCCCACPEQVRGQASGLHGDWYQSRRCLAHSLWGRVINGRPWLKAETLFDDSDILAAPEPQETVAVVERCGKFSHVAQPGAWGRGPGPVLGRTWCDGLRARAGSTGDWRVQTLDMGQTRLCSCTFCCGCYATPSILRRRPTPCSALAKLPYVSSPSGNSKNGTCHLPSCSVTEPSASVGWFELPWPILIHVRKARVTLSSPNFAALQASTASMSAWER